jgi:PAS domain S-box-containing protein
MTELSSYVSETLWEDEECVLARRVSDREPSSHLALTPASARPAPESVTRLEHAYALRNELDSAWAARPVALEDQEGRPTLFVEDPGGEILAQIVGKPWDLTPFLRVAIGLAVTLGRLHHRGLIHKDIKPANILVNRVTGEVWLTGFGIASRLPRERQAPAPPEIIAGTLAYMAPEQTGRMNRSIDSRSDLYALGVTLYEMLTGSLPFTASDPMEWIHCHIARQPTPPSERANGIPDAVAAIVVKLLAKTAEERYQTAAGVESDLRRCLAEWETQGRIDEFELGEHDTSDRLLVPEKLYGRAREVDTLLASFDRVVAGGRPELVLVSGYSGVGKSSVVNELHKPLVPPRGLFASGKFDQYKRDIPYATLAQAFQSLIRPLLSKTEEELSKWRDALHEALDPNGLLIVDLVPELKHIIGEQPPVPELPPQDAQGRFQVVFRRFMSVFARPEHPLVLFLDDLQWFDAATLDLMEDLLTRPDVQHLMLIGAYRDNEVSSTHPLMRKLEAIRQAGATVQEIVLAPLAREDLGQLIADSLHCEPDRAAPLAQLVHEKTAGNPFFTIQFIYALDEEALLTFDHGEGRWSWDLNRIHAKDYTDNVVDLMVGKLNRLPIETQNALQQLACLGNSADFATLRMVYQDSNEEMHGQLWEAVRAGLIFRSEDSYKFLHDRVQEAAYSLIPPELRAETHLRIGTLLAAHTPPEKREQTIFEIVNQLTRGAALITSAEEREQVAELNLIAGQRAKQSTAYNSALTYLAAGRALLPEDCWERWGTLTFALEFHRAECEFLTGALAAAEERLSMLSSRAGRLVDFAAVTHLREELFTTLGRSDRAIEVCLDYLRHVGVELSAHPMKEEVRQEYERLWRQIGRRSIEDLVDLSPMTDPEWRATIDVLTAVVSPALFTDENLLCLVICRMANLSLEHGNSDGSCFAYVWLGMILGPHFGDYRAGFRFGKLGLDLVERGLRRFEARVYLIFGHRVIPWTQPIRTGRSLVRRAFDAANKLGDLTFAAYSCDNLITNLLASGDPLDDVQREAEAGLDFARQARFGMVIDRATTQLRLIRTLRGLTPEFASFNDTEFDEGRFEQHLEEEPQLAMAACWYWIRKLQARFFAGAYACAIAAAANAERLLWTSPSFFELAEYHLYAALTRAALCNAASAAERTKHLEAVAAHHKQLEIWAENCPENFENRAALVGAEIARIEGCALDAERLYEQAIRSAHANGFVHNEALANELAARFYAARGLATISDAYLWNARSCYLRWGADGKVRQLDQTYPHLRQEPPSPRADSTVGAPVEHLDLATVVKVSQAVSSEIVLDKVIETLLMIALEHAGAERGLLILPRGDGLRIEAEAKTSRDTVEVCLRQARVTLAELPESVLHYVIRTQESVLLDDASAANQFSGDEYIRQKHARSVLCLPLIKQSKLIGILYLENNLTPHAFTAARLAVLRLLASQAAISLENGRLYTEVQQSEDHFRLAIDTIPMMVAIARPDGSTDFLNQRWLEYTGLSLEQGLGQGWQAAVDHEDRPRFVAEWRAALAAEESLETEARVRRADGECRWLLIRAVPLRDEKGNIIKWYGTGTDIEDRKQAEEIRTAQARQAVVRADVSAALSRPAHSGEILRGCAEAIVRHLDAAFARIWTLNKQKNILELQASAGMYTHLDGAHSRIPIGKLKIGLIAEEKKPHLTNDVMNDPRITEKIWVQNEGMVSFAGYPLIVQDRVVGVMAMFARQRLSAATLETLASVADSIAHGIERRQAEEKIRQSESYLAEAQRLSLTGSFGWNVLSGEIFWSDETYRIAGIDRGTKPTLEHVLQRIHPQDIDFVRETIERASQAGMDLDFEHRFVVPNGSVKYVHVVAHAVRDETGKLQYVGAVMDLTERKLAEDALRKSQAELAHVTRVMTLGELTASIAHEVNQPLAAILANASACLRWLMGDSPNLEEARETARRIIRDGKRASEVINGIRALVRKTDSEKAPLDINQAVQEVINLTEHEAVQKGVTLRTELTGALPFVLGDRVQLQQVILNLIMNGVEAMSSVTDRPRELLVCSRQYESDQVLVAVQDSGVGIDRQNLEKIFDTFYTTKPQGMGMGLAISRSIVENHGGRLWAVPNDGPGTTFQFTLLKDS